MNKYIVLNTKHRTIMINFLFKIITYDINSFNILKVLIDIVIVFKIKIFLHLFIQKGSI